MGNQLRAHKAYLTLLLPNPSKGWSGEGFFSSSSLFWAQKIQPKRKTVP